MFFRTLYRHSTNIFRLWSIFFICFAPSIPDYPFASHFTRCLRPIVGSLHHHARSAIDMCWKPLSIDSLRTFFLVPSTIHSWIQFARPSSLEGNVAFTFRFCFAVFATDISHLPSLITTQSRSDCLHSYSRLDVCSSVNKACVRFHLSLLAHSNACVFRCSCACECK